MAQTIQILRTTTNVAPTTLLPGALSAELGPQTKLWIGSGSGNRLLLSSDPADAAAAGGAYLKLAGGTLTGALTLAADPSVALGAATKQYADAKDALRLALTGGALSGPLTLAADPSANLGAATKQYVDAAAAASAAADTVIRNTYLAIAGGTLTGALTLAADPAAALQAATRQYVDGKAGATVASAPPSSPKPGQLWWDANGGQLYVFYDDGNSQQWVPASTVPGLSLPMTIAQGGTGQTTAAAALAALGIVATRPTTQSFLTGNSSGTYVSPANVKWIDVMLVGAGGGGGGSGQSPTAGNPGQGSTFGSSLLSAGGGAPGNTGGGPGNGGSASGGFQNINGGQGGTSWGSPNTMNGGVGGSSALGGAGAGGSNAPGPGQAGAVNTGGGGGGGGCSAGAGVLVSGGGGSGAYVRAILAPGSYGYGIGLGGAGGGAGTLGAAGGVGGTGGLWVIEHYNY